MTGPEHQSLNPHAELLRAAAETAGVATSIHPCEGPHAALSLETRSGTVFHRLQQFRWADDRGWPGALVNGRSAPLSDDKHRTKERLAEAGIPTPPGRLFAPGEVGAALEFAADCTGELCIKQNRGANGALVFPGLRDAMAIVEACRTVAAHGRDILVEESIAGEAWRFFYVQPDVVGVKLGRPASVLGDGRRTIGELVKALHAERARRQVVGHTMAIPDGPLRVAMLEKQGVTMASTPRAGVRVFLNPMSNGAQGADSLSLPGALHPSYAERMRDAFEAMPDLVIAAADVIVRDRAAPAGDDNFAVLEINTGPSLTPFHHPWEGPVQDICGPIIDLFQRLRGPAADN